MDQNTILEILGGGGSELEALKENLEQLAGFLKLVEAVDRLPQMDRRVSEEGVSLYHAISKDKEMGALESVLSVFFGEPVKRAGEPLSGDLKDNLTINYLGGIKQDQILFLKTVGRHEMYGALFPWQRKVNVITVHLGLYNPVMPGDDYEKLEKLVTETITRRISEEVGKGLAGKVHGFSLPSFLQMSEMEGSTCSLSVSSGNNTGMLHLFNGNLIDAETGELKHRDAAFAILGWDNPDIEILKSVGRTKNEIKLPLTQLLMESMRHKDLREFERDALPGQSVAKTSPKKGVEKKPEREKASSLQAPTETTPENIVQQMPTPASGPEKSHSMVLSGMAEVVAENGSLTGESAGPAEEVPPGPQKKEPPSDKVIEKDLIQEGASLRPKSLVVDKSAMVLKLKNKVAMLTVSAILVMCVGGYFIFQWIKGGAFVSDYQQLITKLERLSDADAQEKLLMDFINTHEPGEDTTRAEMKLQEIWQQNEDANYQKTIDAVSKLPIDQVFEENAKAIYARFLKKYPDSRHAEEIQRAVSAISGLSEDIVFGKLKNLGEKNYTQKIDSYKNYLSLYPQGKHRDSVIQMFSETLGESYIDFEKKIAICEREAKWDTCLTICEDYLTAFSDYLDTGEIKDIQNRMQMQKDYAVLQTQVQGEDDGVVRRLYMAYMTTYPDSPNNEVIKNNLEQMDRDAAAGRQWASLKKELQNSGLSLQVKIDRIEKFISRDSTGRYAAEAKETLKTLREEAYAKSVAREQSIKNLSSEEKAKKEDQEKYAALVKRQAELDRVRREKQKAIAALEETQGRFVLWGESTVMDQKTGLMWSLLDSQAELGVCMDYRTARRYVSELRYNGQDDWRLPTSAELAGIYKNKPYFPGSGTGWYWTSEIFAKGYSYIANTVSGKQETVFKKVTHDVEACGAVRAVRP